MLQRIANGSRSAHRYIASALQFVEYSRRRKEAPLADLSSRRRSAAERTRSQAKPAPLRSATAMRDTISVRRANRKHPLRLSPHTRSTIASIGRRTVKICQEGRRFASAVSRDSKQLRLGPIRAGWTIPLARRRPSAPECLLLAVHEASPVQTVVRNVREMKEGPSCARINPEEENE
jgi:hypothetical protein